MPQFSPDQVTFQDNVAYGFWDDAHHREHLQFVQILAMQTPSVGIPTFDFLQMLTAGNARKSVLETHNAVHALLRQITGVAGVDYSQFNYDDSNDFYSFTGYHADEHSQIRQVLGITT